MPPRNDASSRTNGSKSSSKADVPSTRPLLEKLGVKPGSTVALFGDFPDWFNTLVSERAASVIHGPPGEPADVVFLLAETAHDLARLRDLRERIVANGAIWVVTGKGKQATLRDVDVINAALDAGLVDNKVVSFSDTHTSLRLVIRLRDRPRAHGGLVRG